MEGQHDSSNHHANGIRLSPLALIVLSFAVPLVSTTIGSVFRDRITTGTETVTVQTKVDGIIKEQQALEDALKAHLADAVHRNEFNTLQSDAHEKVSREEFLTASKSVDTRLEEIRDDLKDIKDSLRGRSSR